VIAGLYAREDHLTPALIYPFVLYVENVREILAVPQTRGVGDKRWELGLWAVLMGLAALVIAFSVVALRWRDQTGLAALGVVCSPIAAIVSAYFGIQYGQKAAEQAAEVKKDAEIRATRAEESKINAMETLRKELLPKLEEAAMEGSLPQDQAQGFAAKAWDDARSAVPG
jgi:hypothetical protein